MLMVLAAIKTQEVSPGTLGILRPGVKSRYACCHWRSPHLIDPEPSPGLKPRMVTGCGNCSQDRDRTLRCEGRLGRPTKLNLALSQGESEQY